MPSNANQIIPQFSGYNRQFFTRSWIFYPQQFVGEMFAKLPVYPKDGSDRKDRMRHVSPVD